MQRNFITSTFRRAGGSYSRGTVIDGYLSDEDIQKLYEKWDIEWGEPLEFQGGTKGITCEMVLEAPKTKFKEIMGAAGKRILDAAQVNAGG